MHVVQVGSGPYQQHGREGGVGHQEQGQHTQQPGVASTRRTPSRAPNASASIPLKGPADDRAPAERTALPPAPPPRPCRRTRHASRSVRWQRPAAVRPGRSRSGSARTPSSAPCSRHWRGYQRETRTTADMKLPAQPSPTTKRASASPEPVSANACSSAPATMNTDKAETVMRGPMRSNSTPTKICGSSSARKKLPLAKPRASADSDRSRISSGPMTEVEARKNCDRMVVAASIASSVAAALQDTDGNCAGAGAAGTCNGSFKATALLPRAIPDGSGPQNGIALARSCDVLKYPYFLHALGCRANRHETAMLAAN